MTTPLTRRCNRRDGFDDAGLADKEGLQKARALIGRNLDSLMNATNVGLVR